MRVLVVFLVALSLGAATAVAAIPKPDAHDRALALQLAAKVATFREVANQKNSNDWSKQLDKCAYLKKHPKDAFAAIFALLPALLIEVVNEYKPQLVALRDTITGMHPDSTMFQQWLTAEGKNFSLMLEFDNHGQKVDLCAVVTVMLTKTSTADDVQRVLGISPALVGKLYSNDAAGTSKTISRLNPKMRKFFIAAGVPRKDAISLTSSS